MAGLNRRSSFSSSTVSSSSLAKRPAMENAPKVSVSAPENAKKRMALGNLTNQCNAGRSGSRQPGAKGNNVGEIRKKANTTVSAAKVKKGPSGTDPDKSFRRNYSITPSIIKPVTCGPRRSATPAVRNEATVPVGSLPVPCNSVLSPKRSGDSVSVDETMSTCDSMKSPDFEYIDNADSSVVASLERKATHNLYISDNFHSMGHGRKSGVPVAMEIDSITNVDDNYKDPQLCASLACDIYQHLRFAETKKRPSMDFMERVQEDINANMRAILIDWLVEVAEEYRLVPDTLYLTVNYIDRYLSDNKINRQRLQLLGVACMLIAAKYEEICAPQVEEFCYITDNTYFKDEVLQMEANVLKFLKFEMTSPTAKCFLRRFVRVAQCSDEVPSSLQLEFLANYLAELSLLEYSMLCHSPSRIAAASVFLAKFILQPSKRPWNATLVHYTQYKPSELGSCVKDLHRLCCNNSSNSLPAIREKYSQHKYKFVAKKYCPAAIPPEFFQDSCK